jgi:flagellar basal-body rod modification protein FlgD
VTVTAISGSGTSDAAQGITINNATSSEMDGLGQEAFLTLLLAQLENQDPLKPMADTEFIAQLAQFNSLSELTKINESLQQLMSSQKLVEGSALIGKVVTGLSSSGEQMTGVVQGVYLSAGSILLDVDGVNMPLDMVSIVRAPEPEPESEPVSTTGL